jgi:ABC-2 type transport system permease protein
MNPTITRLALAALAGHRRFWLLLAFPVGLAALTVLVRVLSGDAALAGDTLLAVGFTLVLPLLALVSATAVMGPEIDDGSIVYLLSKPVSRHAVAFSKYLVAALATLLFGSLPLLLVGLAVDGEEPGRWLAVWTAAALCGVTYCGLFLALSTLWRHAVVASLLYVLLWEGVLASIFSGVAWLSIQMWGQRLAASLDDAVSRPDITLWWALLASAVITVGGVWFSGDRLRSYQLRGDE